MGAPPISNNIRRLRFDADEMTQKALAEAVGVTRQTIVAIENAKYSPTLELAFKIARAFDKPLEDVFHYDAVIAGEKTMTDTIDQDVELLAGVQKGMSSQGFGDVFLNEDEMRVQHFHNEMDRLIS